MKRSNMYNKITPTVKNERIIGFRVRFITIVAAIRCNLYRRCRGIRDDGHDFIMVIDPRNGYHK